MPWDKTPGDRQRDAQVYGPEYRRNAALCKKRANGRCTRCGKHTTRLEADHITPVTQGGGHDLGNLQALCLACHRAKTAREGGGWQRPKLVSDPEPTPGTQW